MNSKKTTRFVIGFFLILVGLIFFGVQAGLISASLKYLLFSWPAFLIYFALFLLLQSRKSYSFIFLLLGIGGFFMLERVFATFPNLAPYGLNLSNFRVYFWPFILVLLGIYIIFKPSCSHKKCGSKVYGKRKRVNVGKDEGGFYDKNIVFGNYEHFFLDSEFVGGDVNVVCGSTVLDLRRSTLPPDGSSLEVNAVMGEIVIYVPETWNVVSNIDVVFGQFENKRLINNDSPDAPKLILNGAVVLGNISLI